MTPWNPLFFCVFRNYESFSGNILSNIKVIKGEKKEVQETYTTLVVRVSRWSQAAARLVQPQQALVGRVHSG